MAQQHIEGTYGQKATHGIKSTSRKVVIPMESGNVLEINPCNNIVWVWSEGMEDCIGVFHMSDLLKATKYHMENL